MDNLPPPPPYAEEDPRPAQPPVYPSSSSSSRAAGAQAGSSTAADDGDDNPYMSAAPYFEVRQTTQPRPRDVLSYILNIQPNASPATVAFPTPAKKFTDRGINKYDWSTFLNHVFPLHGVPRPSQLQRPQYGGDEKRPMKVSKPAPVNNPSPGEPVDVEKETRRRSQIQKVVQEWNMGFFLPRGVRITVRSPPISTLTDLDAKSGGGVTALYRAVEKGDVKLVETLLLRGANPDSKPFGGNPTTYMAADKGDDAILKLLLTFGANPDANALGNGSALWVVGYKAIDEKPDFDLPLSEESPSTVKMVHLLLDFGADVNFATAGSQPLLCKAAESGYLSLSRLLIERGADGDKRPWGCRTALYSASIRGDMTLTQMLIKSGADVDETLAGEQTALYHAVDRDDLEMVKTLLKAGASINKKPWGGVTPLVRAIEKGNEEVLGLFLETPGKGETKAEVVGEMKRIAEEKGLGQLFQEREDDAMGGQ